MSPCFTVLASGTADNFQTRDPAREVTVRDLLMHTSGLVARDTASTVGELYRRAGFKGLDSDFPLAEMVKRLEKIPLQVDPGSHWIYGISTDLVGYLCEVISGIPFDHYLEERILGPQDPITLRTRNNLGNTLISLGKFQEANANLRRAIV